MNANDIVLYFSIIVSVCVVIWAFIFIRAYDRIDKNK